MTHSWNQMADAAGSVIDYFGGNMAFINVMKNLSVDCDCSAVAEPPCMKDIGILVSTDPVAVDQACLDLVYAATDDPGQAHSYRENRKPPRRTHNRSRRRTGSRQQRIRTHRS